jgi:hypothetical protein
MNALEELRRSFRPDCITTLFMGESAPRSGKFFYTQNTNLYRAMQSAFAWKNDFLSEFKARGFYLDDLSLIPVNGMERKERRRQLEESIASLSHRLIEYKPRTIVILLRSIDPLVRQAAQQAALTVPMYTTTYPGRFQSLRQQFQNEMAVIIPQLSASR